jgi:hypothetical protein
MNKALYNKFIVLLTSRLLQTNTYIYEDHYHVQVRIKQLFTSNHSRSISSLTGTYLIKDQLTMYYHVSNLISECAWFSPLCPQNVSQIKLL